MIKKQISRYTICIPGSETQKLANRAFVGWYKGPVSSFNGAPPPQHTFGASKAVYANANMNGGYGYSYAMTPQPLPSYGRGQAFTVGGGFRGRGGIPAFQYQIQPGNNPYKYVAPKPSPPGVDMMEKPMGPEEVALLNKFLHKKVDLMQNSGIDVSLDRNDPRSPLHSIRSFRDLRLRPELLEALNLLGFTQPSKIQEFALPLLIMEPPTNIIAQSQSGTGKTATFVLTMLSRVDPSNKYPQCLCLAPTYDIIEEASPVVQTMLFSATYGEDVVKFAMQLIKNAVTVTLKREDQSLPNIKQYFVECPGRDAKYQAVVELYSGLTIASCVIFTHTRRSASWLAERMIEKGHLVGVLHGEMSVEERAASIEQFKEGIFKVLITTNVCARGIDVSQVTIVINYDPPLLYENPTEPDYDTYLHRIGRTGRFGKAGIAINFVDSREALAIIKKIEAFFGKPIPKLDPSDLEQLEAVEND
ncbi:helicase protein [Necator americanus]|uniref:RNA helicase n=1 Tax=Necator americanus TaxID=51031 RepID=W2T2J0_NECAM|nr:helicase protein [Necator americanus]ETN76225.1 helicase protein [Necator americanus]